MPQFRITAPDGTVYNVTGPEGATEQDALAQVQAQHSAAPVAPQPEEGLGSAIGHYVGGIQEGIARIPQGAVELGARGLDATGLTDHAYDKTHAVFQDMNEIGTPGLKEGNKYVQGGDTVGKVIGTLPVSAAFPGTLPGVIGSGAVTGALSDPEHPLESAAIGAGGGAALHGVGKAIAPGVSAAVQNLARNGVTMTPGMIFGGATKGLEDRAAGIWPLNSWIGEAKNQAMRTGFNGGAAGGVNSALAPLERVGGQVPVGPGIVPEGFQFPADIPTSVPEGTYGQDAVRFAGDTLGDAYNTILPRTQTALGPDFWNGIATNVGSVARELPPERAAQVQSTLSGIFGRLGNIGDPANTHTVIDGQTMKAMDTKLGQLFRNFSGSADPDQRAMAGIYRDVQSNLRDAVSASNPDLAPQLSAINEGYRNLVPVETAAAKATGNAGGLDAGVASPQQYRAAIKQADTSVRDRMTARGQMPGQQYAEDAINVLPSSIGSSGTSERLGLFALPALAASMAAHPVGAAAALAVPALYSKPGLQVLNKLYAHGAGPGATALGGLFQNLGRFGAGPASGALTSGGRQ